MTEAFAEITDPVRKVALSALGLPTVPVKATGEMPTLPAEKSEQTLVERIRSAADKIASRAEAELALNKVAEQLRDIPLTADTKQFCKELQEQRESRPTGTKAIGEWLSNNEDRGFFATSNKKRESYQKRVMKSGLFAPSSLSRLISGKDNDDDYRMITAYRDVVTGYSLTCAIPYEKLVIRLDPQTSVLTPEECAVLPLVSRTHVRLFWSFTHFEYTDWEVSVPRTRTEWFSDEAPLKDFSALDILANRIKTAFAKNVDSALAAKWVAQPPSVTSANLASVKPPTGRTKKA